MADPMITENDKKKSKYIVKYQTIKKKTVLKQNEGRIIPNKIYRYTNQITRLATKQMYMYFLSKLRKF
jgi:hypothetical protein